MTMRFAALLLLAFLEVWRPSPSRGGELSGWMAAEENLFFHAPRLPVQKEHPRSVALQAEYYHQWADGSSVTVIPFARFDSADEQRTHADLRELNYLTRAGEWELRIGMGKVFWGVAEFVHLVDIINQTDLVEEIDGEDKLGQPMLHLSLPRQTGTFDLFILPYFRPRTFPGAAGRLRSSLPVDGQNPEYESSRKARHIDLALRYSRSRDNIDAGLSYFRGTEREPTLHPGRDDSGRPVLIPRYEQIDQAALDLQAVAGQWLYKLEVLYRSGQGSSYIASVCGVEYTLFGLAGTAMDIGMIGEWAYDGRDDGTAAFENDAIFGLRLAINDAAGTEFLGGWARDLDSAARAVSIEASRRFGSSMKFSVKGRGFSKIPGGDPASGLADDDFIRLEVRYYF